MGSTASAHLAYGFDLGNIDNFRAAERDEYGGPAPTWYSDDEGRPEFAVQLCDALYAATGLAAEGDADRRQSAAEQRYGVEVAFCGTDEYQGWVLIVTGSERDACNADVLTLDPFVLERTPVDEGWDGKLETALKALGITPTQDGPAWLVFPSYG